MFKPAVLVTFFLLTFVGQAQLGSLPADLRQHTLNQYNASLFNPAFSLDRNNPQSVAFWTRWQWQNIDADPTTLFLNYTRSLNENSAASVGFFQHNTGVFFNTGGVINYAYQIRFNRLIKLSFGANVFGFVQELADTRFPVTPIPGIPQTAFTNDFILQVAPGLNVQIENFSLGLASENLFDYNFRDKESNTATSDKIFMGMASYDFPVMASDSTAYIRPSIYIRTIPEEQNQVGLNALFSTEKYWVQSGFNNFYGISVGAGGTFFNRFSVGALVEFGTSGSVNSQDPSFEILASYFLGKPQNRRPKVVSGILEIDQQVLLAKEEMSIEEMKEALENAEKSSNEEDNQVKEAEKEVIADAKETKEEKKEAKRLAAEKKAQEKQQRRDSIAEIKKEKAALAQEKKQEDKAKLEAETAAAEQQKEAQKRKADSISDAKKAAAIATELRVKEQNKLDSIANIKKTEAMAEAQKIQEQQRIDSVARANEARELAAKKAAAIVERTKEITPEVVKPQAGEKYQEVAKEDGLEPGYYLIANVFGTKKYFDAFMNDLRSQGLQPKSFYRSQNKYNYAYIERYNTIREARQARDSKFDGKYSGKTWIFRVVGK